MLLQISTLIFVLNLPPDIHHSFSLELVLAELEELIDCNGFGTPYGGWGGSSCCAHKINFYARQINSIFRAVASNSDTVQQPNIGTWLELRDSEKWCGNASVA